MPVFTRPKRPIWDVWDGFEVALAGYVTNPTKRVPFFMKTRTNDNSGQVAGKTNPGTATAKANDDPRK